MNIITSQKLKNFPIKHGFSTKLYINRDRIIFPNQNHTNTVVTEDFSSQLEADALVTTKKHFRIGIKTADCVPILMFEKHKGIIAAVHAGWKGTVNKILTKTIASMVALGGRPKYIYAVLGPSIGQCCYNISAERSSYFSSKFLVNKRNKSFLNLKEANIEQLITMRVPVENIDSTPWCTSCNNDMFYSYRREQPLVKQNVSFIELN